MVMLEPQGTAGWTYYGRGGQYIKSMPQLPAAEQETDVFGMLDQQHKQQIQQLDSEFASTQETIMSSARYKLKTLSDKYTIERQYVEGLRIPVDQKRQKLLQLNTKYELAAATARGKITPDIDLLKNQRAQAIRNLEQQRAVKQIRMDQIRKSLERGDIVDPAAALKEQYEVLGYNYPISAFRAEPVSPEDQIKEIDMAIGNIQEELQHYTKKDIKWGPSRGKELVRYPEATTTGLYGKPRYTTEEEKETFKGLQLTLADLITTRNELMAQTYPEYATAFRKAGKLSKVGLQMQAGRKPGTLAEGIWQQKRKQIRPITQKRHWAVGPGMPEAKKQKEIKTQPTPRYATNPTTGETVISYDGGKSWQRL